MLESFKSGKFTYKRIPLEEQKSRGILGRLAGIIADTKEPTRNGRHYGLDLWKNVFENPIMKEKIANHLVLGELGHPEGREETDISKAAICLAEQPKISDDGKIYGVFDILSTPNGHILKSLCDYGCHIGISSRGTGDLIDGVNGQEVDPDTYNCECWDAVIVPAVESARLTYVTEALDTTKYKKTLRQKLSEDLENAEENDRAIMKEALDKMGIDLGEEEELEEEVTRAWLLRQEGTTIPQTVHTKLRNNAVEDVIESDAIHEELRKYYDLTEREEVRDLIDKLFNHIEKGSDDLDTIDYLYKLIFDNFNTEFCKVRVGGMYGDDGESEIYFRIASKNVNWYDAICKFMMSHKNIAEFISVLSDIEILHKEVYKTLDGKEINHMPVEEFIMAKGSPIVESKRVSPFVYNIYEGKGLIESYGPSNYIGHISNEYDTSKDITEGVDMNRKVKLVKAEEEPVEEHIQKLRATQIDESISESHINEAPEQDGAWYGPRTDYTVKIQKVKPGTRVHNKLENADYTTNEQKCYVITGTVGEQWPVDAKKVQQKYICDLQALESGKPVDAKINPEAVKGDKGYFTVCKQPIEVKTDWGDVLHAEPGDMLRSNGPGQEPDRVVDPGVFKTTYQKLNESISESCGDKDDVKEEVVNDKSDEFAAELQEALSKNKKLVKDNLSLQEKLSVCTAKEAKLEEELKKYKASTAHLSETAKKVRPLKRDLNSLTEELEKKDSILKANKTRFNELVGTANEAIAKLEESNKVNKNLKNKVKNLNEQLEATQVKVDNSQALVKKYQKALRESRDALVQAKADAYGIEKDDILSNLNESYNLKQLNSVCEELQDRKRNLSKLPFRVNSTSKMQIKEAKETITGRDSYMNDDDYVSDSLLDMLK